MGKAHPYYPQDLVLPGFEPLVLRPEVIVGVFFALCGALVVGGWTVSGRAKGKPLVTSERLTLCWFLCCGFIHLVVEGTVVLNSKFFQDTSGNLLNEIWKEYAKADSRYASRDDFIIVMEGVTAFLEGPGCFLIVWGLLARKPWRHAAIVLVSLGQFYGNVLYFGTCIFGGAHRFTRPEPLYFWFYFVIINGIWLVIPGICMYSAIRSINAAVASVEGGKKAGSRAKLQ